jgi:hypothetical protein
MIKFDNYLNNLIIVELAYHIRYITYHVGGWLLTAWFERVVCIWELV